jgi:thiol-disulfide isomerase/thioredoxin
MAVRHPRGVGILASMVALVLGAAATGGATGESVATHGAISTPDSTSAVAPAQGTLGQYALVSGTDARALVRSLRGQVVVLNLWATWCPPCVAEFPALVELQRKYRDRGLNVVALSADEPGDIDSKVRPFVEKSGATFGVIVKAPGDVGTFLRQVDAKLSGSLPETIVYDRDGNRAAVLLGEQSLEEFERAIRGLL